MAEIKLSVLWIDINQFVIDNLNVNLNVPV